MSTCTGIPFVLRCLDQTNTRLFIKFSEISIDLTHKNWQIAFKIKIFSAEF